MNILCNSKTYTHPISASKFSSISSLAKTMKIVHLTFFSFLQLCILLAFLVCSTCISAQSPKAAPGNPTPTSSKPPTVAVAPTSSEPTLPETPADAPDAGPTDIVRILKKAKDFTVFTRLLKTTQLINNINSQLITSKSGGLTILAPNDGAFSALKPGFLNSLSDEQKIELLQFHVLPNYVSSSNFDTLANPVRTLAGADPVRLQFNVTTYGNSVNISTGEVNATVTAVVYSDKQLAIYQVDKVLLPLDFFIAKAPAPTPAVAEAPKSGKKKSSPDDDTDDAVPADDKSGAMGFITHGIWVSLALASVAWSMI